ncbi:MAG: hypothetical protein HYY86_01160 [Candidatus Harrisonbacteria bacterium]|nr:hypothetical protein [Candidatus Harrisonbacteria bacterium]
MKKQKEKVMKIRYHSGYSCRMNGLAVGTPTEIVDHMFKDRSPFLKVRTKADYMSYLAKAVRSAEFGKDYLRGKTHEARCRSFLNIMLKSGHIKELSLKSC